MPLRQFQVDAFTDHVFGGNPAAVVRLPAWPADALLQAIAEENNLSETAFFVPDADGFQLRWFTPTTEIDLCGHATLAAAHVLFEHLGHAGPVVAFTTRSGPLAVRREGEGLVMDFPASPPRPCLAPPGLGDALGRVPVEVLQAEDYIAVFDTETEVRAITPDMDRLRGLGLRGVAVTAPGSDVDFVSRFFAPKYGIPEDPVTGSAHCELAPYWATRLGKRSLVARQVSRRGGEVRCGLEESGRVLLEGRAVTFLEGRIVVPVEESDRSPTRD
jgi:predicted PhzF superfamily epimerase YddE/YHI9